MTKDQILRQTLAALVETGWITGHEYDHVYTELSKITDRDINLNDIDAVIQDLRAIR